MPNMDPNVPPPNPFEPEDPTPTARGNRPADGARQARPGEVLSQSFQSSENAGDFLGLDLEFETESGGQDPGAGFAPDGFDAQSAETVRADYVFDEMAEDEDEHEPFEEELAGSSHELDRDFEEPKSRTLVYAVGAFVMGLLGVAGVKYGPQLYERFAPSDGGLEVAGVPTPSHSSPSAGSQPGPDPGVATHTTAGIEDPTPVAADDPPVVETIPTDPADGTPIESFLPGTETGGQDPAPFPTNADPVDLGAVPGTNPTSTQSGAETITLSTAPAGNPVLDLLTGSDDVEPFTLPDASSTFEALGGDNLDVIWRSPQIPHDAIASAARVLTPHVGHVRVHLDSGELFEGRLFGLGQHRVWVDTQPGRVGLDGDRVTRIERLPEAAVQARQAGSQLVAGDQVRVRVPGGFLYGRVVKEEGENLTLVTTNGGRVTVHGAAAEPIASRRAVIVQR